MVRPEVMCDGGMTIDLVSNGIQGLDHETSDGDRRDRYIYIYTHPNEIQMLQIVYFRSVQNYVLK